MTCAAQDFRKPRYLVIAQWIQKQGRPVTTTEICDCFGLSRQQAGGVIYRLKNDIAFRVITGWCQSQHPRLKSTTIMVLEIDMVLIQGRLRFSRQPPYCQEPVSRYPRTVAPPEDLSRTEKWQWIIRNAWKGHKRDNSV